MTLVVSENFDGVTAPAIPSDVTVALAAGDSAVTSTSQFLSSPNSISAINAGSGPQTIIYSASSDSSSGNCIVNGSFLFTGSPAATYFGPIIAVGGKWVHGAGNDNSYFIICQIISGGAVALYRSNSGTGTVIGSTNGVGVSFASGIWYTMTLVRSGSSLFFTCQRQSDSKWLGSGTNGWQTDYATCLSVTDGSPLSATASYGGLFLGAATGAVVYGDNLSVKDFNTTLPSGPIKGMNLGPANSLGQRGDVNGGVDYWNQFALTGVGGIQTQIQLAKSAGCNCIRTIGAMRGIFQGVYSQSKLISEMVQVAKYCRSQKLWFYLSMDAGCAQGASSGDPEASVFGSITSVISAVASAFVGMPNIIGFDLRQEFNGDVSSGLTLFNGTTTTTGTYTMTAAQLVTLTYQCVSVVRPILPNVPLACSFNGIVSSAGWTTDYPTYCYLFDYLDQHVYYTPGASDSQAVYTNAGASGKKLFLGEFGDSMTDSGATRTARLNAVWSNVVQASYSGQPGCIGGEWWSAIPQDSVASNDFGMWDGANPAVARADVEPTFAGFSAQSVPFFGGGGRRRRPR